MTVENAPDALGGSVKGLITLRKRLQRLHGNRYTFSRTSGNQADTAYEAFKRGAELSKSDFIATMFGNSLHVRQFQAAVFVTSAAIRKLIDAVEHAHGESDLIVCWACFAL